MRSSRRRINPRSWPRSSPPAAAWRALAALGARLPAQADVARDPARGRARVDACGRAAGSRRAAAAAVFRQAERGAAVTGGRACGDRGRRARAGHRPVRRTPRGDRCPVGRRGRRSTRPRGRGTPGGGGGDRRGVRARRPADSDRHHRLRDVSGDDQLRALRVPQRARPRRANASSRSSPAGSPWRTSSTTHSSTSSSSSRRRGRPGSSR